MAEPIALLTPSRPSLPRRLADAVALRLLLATAAATVLALFARLHWIFDDLTSFTVQYAITAALCLAVLLALRRFRWAALAAVTLAVNVFRLWPEAHPPAAVAGPPLRLLSANVHASSRNFDKFTSFIEAESPDLLLVLEVGSEWAEALAPLRDRYPHSTIHPRQDNFGIAFFSRVPAEIDVVELGGAELPSIVARLTHDGRPLTVIGTHPLPPVSSATAAARNTQFAAVAKAAREAEGAVIVGGDLNVSPWSPHFRDLLRNGRLSDSGRGFGPQPTWPAFFPPLMTPIDHVLVSDGLTVLNRRVGPGIGSDHRPVVAEIAFGR
jgi:endonuclease/exonuclease/phosphatase (EEP) superfamily protein YafD